MNRRDRQKKLIKYVVIAAIATLLLTSFAPLLAGLS